MQKIQEPLTNLLLSIGIMVLLQCQLSCSSKSSPLFYSEGKDPLQMSAEEKALLDFNIVYQNVLRPKCVSCHGNAGGVNLETYENTYKNLAAIQDSVFSKGSMPKNGSLNSQEKRILWNWLEMRAPADPSPQNSPEPFPQNSPNPTPNPIPPDNSGPTSLVPTYESIYQNIFVSKCLDCHAPNKEAKNILLTKENLLNSPLELVIKGDPDNSGLMIAIERKDLKRMPPASEGYSPLGEKEISTIRTWIEKGAED
jgi:mono/diheme cytochrome c family protein